MDDTASIETPANSEKSITNEKVENTVVEKSLEMPELIPDVGKIIENKSNEISLVDELGVLVDEPEVTNTEPIEVKSESPAKVLEATVEVIKSDDSNVDLPLENNIETIAEKTVEKTELTETNDTSNPVEIIESIITEVSEPHIEEITNTANIEDAENSATLELPETSKITDEVPAPDTEFQVAELPDTEYTVEEVTLEQNTSGDAPIEQVMEAENAVAQIIPEESEEPQPQIPDVDEHVLIDNDISFVSESQEEPKDSFTEETNASNEIEDVEYVVLDDSESEVISMNGIPELAKDQMDLYEEADIKESSFESHVIENVTITTSDLQSPETTTIISMASDNVTEVTYTDVQVLETPEGYVAINDVSDQAGEEVVILQDENVVLMETEEYDQPESIEVKLLENQDQDESETGEADQEQDENKSVKIPCHVLGRNIDNPLEDPVRNGRVLLKPRLGVKIPYRNLTSQIVSKQDIADEIMERSRLRQSSAEPPAGGDLFFAKKLTQRLAKKLTTPSKPSKNVAKTVASTSGSSSSSSTATTGNSSKKVVSSNHKTVTSSIPKPQTTTVATAKVSPSASINSTKPLVDTSGKITDNSDLIAILEGDDDTEWPMTNIKDSSNVKPTDSTTKSEPAQNKTADWERETALKQLRELPIKSSRYSSKSSFKEVPTKPTPVQNTNKEPPKQPSESSDVKEEISEDLKDDLNVEPRFSSSSVMKTYTRKRKPSEDIIKAATLSGVQPVKKVATVEQKQSSSPKQAPTPSSPKPPSTPVNTQKSSTQKPPSVSVNSQKSSTQQKPATTPSAPKSTNVIGQKIVQKSSTVVQKSSSSSNVPKSSSKTPATPQKASAVEKKPDKKPPTLTSPKSATAEQKSSESTMKKPISPNTYISKSSRIVKKKKIWDPDEATSTFKPSPVKVIKPEVTAEKSVEKKVSKPVTVLKPSNEKAEAQEREVAKSPEKKTARPQVAVLKPNNEKSPAKKIIMKKIIIKKKKPKRLTEVDRLLMDEGAVNLLYSVKNTEELQNLKKKKKKTVISIDRAQRELLNKTNEIKNDLQINSTKDSPISLRKKEGIMAKASPVKDLAATILLRKKSKDSMSGSAHSPPASPSYGYTQHAEASRIIRRHSSSSFSSENMEADENQVAEKGVKHKSSSSESPKKKLKANHEKPSKGSSIGVDKELLNVEMSKNFNKPPTDDPKYAKFETFTIRKFDYLVQIILAPTSTNGQTTLTTKVLAELALVLDILQKDNACRVVLLSSSGNSFCQGIDYKEMVSDNKGECQSIVENFAVCVRNFLTSLSKFSKIVVAGVQGNTIGLGVTMLPLFDMVLASDTATFSTPYARLGCAAEGGVLLTLPHVMHNALASELFFASRKLTAAEALRLGLVTRTLWPDKFQEELISSLKIISGQSLQSMQAIKKQLRHHLLQSVENSLKSESSTLIQHWTSVECQNNFSNYSLDSK